METYITRLGERLRIDRGNNVFLDKECVNPSKYADISLKEHANDIRQMFIEEGAVRTDNKVVVTGHINEFEYTGYDENGKPYPIKVKTGHENW